MLLNNVYVKLSIFKAVYLVLLVFLAPAINHLFTTLEQYEKNKRNNFRYYLDKDYSCYFISNWLVLDK